MSREVSKILKDIHKQTQVLSTNLELLVLAPYAWASIFLKLHILLAKKLLEGL